MIWIVHVISEMWRHKQYGISFERTRAQVLRLREAEHPPGDRGAKGTGSQEHPLQRVRLPGGHAHRGHALRLRHHGHDGPAVERPHAGGRKLRPEQGLLRAPGRHAGRVRAGRRAEAVHRPHTHRLRGHRKAHGRAVSLRVRGRPLQRRRGPDGAAQHLPGAPGPVRGEFAVLHRVEDIERPAPGQELHHPQQRPLRHHRGEHQADGVHAPEPVR